MRIFTAPNVHEATPILHSPGESLFHVTVQLTGDRRCGSVKEFVLMAKDEKDAIQRVDNSCEEGVNKSMLGNASPETKEATIRVLTNIMRAIALGQAWADPLSHSEIFPVSYFDDPRLA